MVRPRASLLEVARTSQVRLLRLRTLAYSATTLSFSTADRLITYVVIQSHTEWAEFIRAFLISCVTGGTRKTGKAVTVGLPSARRPTEMMRIALQIQSRGKKNYVPRRRRDEPAWHSVRLLIPLASKIALSNENAITGAVSTGSPVFSSLPTIRHFYAHRNSDSRSLALHELSTLAIPSYPHPTMSLLAKPAGASNPIIVEWISDLYASADLMCR